MLVNRQTLLFTTIVAIVLILLNISTVLFLDLKYNGFKIYFVLASYKELFFGILFILSAIKIMHSFKLSNYKLFGVVLFIFLLGIVVTKNLNLFLSLLYSRYFLLDILIFVLILHLNIGRKIEYVAIVYLIVFLGFLHVIYSMYNYFNFTGDLNDIWFYKYYILESEKVSFKEYNYITENGMLRGYGFFDTAIKYSLLIDFILFILFFSFLSVNNYMNKFVIFIFFIFFIIGAYIAFTRIVFINLILGILGFYIYQYAHKKSSILAFVFILLIILSTFLYIFMSTDLDRSALGRILQYATLLQNLDNYFMGVSFGLSMEKEYRADSNYIAYIYTTGLFGFILFLYIQFYILNTLSKLLALIKLNKSELVLTKATISFSIMYLYSSAFHFTMGMPAISMYLIISGLIIGKNIKTRKTL